MKKFLFWLAVVNVILSGILLVVEFQDTGFSGVRVSAVFGWVVAAINTAG